MTEITIKEDLNTSTTIMVECWMEMKYMSFQDLLRVKMLCREITQPLRDQAKARYQQKKSAEEYI